jgi:predicted permease
MVTWMKVLFSRIRGWIDARKMDEEFAQELADHSELLTTEYILRGMAPEEARRSARMQMGGAAQIREDHRKTAGLPGAENLIQDVRYALRTLGKKPAFTVVCILTLGLGIGANTAIFSVVNGVLLRPLPYPKSTRLLQIQENHPGGSNANFTYASYLNLEQRSKSLENISAFRPWSFNLTGESEPQQITGALVSGNFFAALGTEALLGRTINAQDNQPGGDNHVVILSFALWQSSFGLDPRILGRVLHVSGEEYRVIGVMPKGFDYPDQSRLWCPLVPEGELHDNRRAHLLTVIADMRSGKPFGSAQGEMAAIAQQIETQNPAVDPDMVITAVSLHKSLVAPVQPALLILTCAVVLLLLLACANVGNMLLAQAEARHKEFAIRIAVGAGQRRLLQQLLTESLVLSALGGALGLGIASQSLHFIATLHADYMPRIGEIRMDWRVLGLTLLVSAFSGLLFGLGPAIAATGTDVNISLKEAVGSVMRPEGNGARRALVIAQFAFAVILLVGAGLVGNSFVRLLKVDPGFNSDGVAAIKLFLSPVEYPEGDRKGTVLLRQVLESVRSVPGLISVGLVNALPITGGPETDFVIQGRPAPLPSNEPSAAIRVADSEYFHTMGIPLLAGREFTEGDNASASRVMLVNQTMARQYWPHEDPIGQRVTMKDWGPPLTGEIVGIVGDVKTNGLETNAEPMIYWPYAQFPQLFNTIVIRSEDDPLRQLPAVKNAIWAVAKNQPISEIATMDQILADSLARRRLYMALMAVFSTAALLLAAVGVYGMLSYCVNRRTHEMGIRLAIGAERKDVLWLVLGEGITMALAGIAVGVAAALVLTRLMSSLLFGVSASDPITFAGVALLILLVALVASYIPARRATRVDPMVALRYG